MIFIIRNRGKKEMGEKGNIAVIAALCLVVLIGMLALVVDGGYLFSTENRYQNAVEAAALAGAHHFADGHDENRRPIALAVARDIAVENGIPEEAVTTEIGIYTVDTATFEADPDPTTPWNDGISTEENPIYNNSIVVTARRNISTFLAGILGKNSVPVSAGAVAYGERNTFTATGTEEGHEGIDLDDRRWTPGYNIFKNCVFRSNGPVAFRGKEYETFVNSRVDILESENITGDAGKVDVVEMSTPLEDTVIDWDDLRARAEENGVVYAHDEMESWPTEWQTDAYGNHYRRSPHGATWVRYSFVPAGRDDDDPGNTAYQGDHEGRTYFFEIPDPLPDDVDGYIIHVQNHEDEEDFCPEPYDRTSWNFTLAARCEFSSLAYRPYTNRITLGNVPEEGDQGIVHIYCQGASEQRGWYTNYASIAQTVLRPKGVIFYTENDFRMETQSFEGYTEERRFFLRCYAKKIRMYDSYHGGMILFNGGFGPLDGIRLGKLEEGGG